MENAIADFLVSQPGVGEVQQLRLSSVHAAQVSDAMRWFRQYLDGAADGERFVVLQADGVVAGRVHEMMDASACSRRVCQQAAPAGTETVLIMSRRMLVTYTRNDPSRILADVQRWYQRSYVDAERDERAGTCEVCQNDLEPRHVCVSCSVCCVRVCPPCFANLTSEADGGLMVYTCPYCNDKRYAMDALLPHVDRSAAPHDNACAAIRGPVLRYLADGRVPRIVAVSDSNLIVSTVGIAGRDGSLVFEGPAGLVRTLRHALRSQGTIVGIGCTRCEDGGVFRPDPDARGFLVQEDMSVRELHHGFAYVYGAFVRKGQLAS